MHTLQGRGGYWGGWAGEDAEGQEEVNEGQGKTEGQGRTPLTLTMMPIRLLS